MRIKMPDINYIDLHMHTNFSDGADEYITVLQKAEEKKLKYMAITDHDNCLVYDEIKKINLKEYFTGVLITGIELQANVMGYSIELLGYGVDTDIINAKVKEIYMPFEKLNIIELERAYKIQVQNGMTFDDGVLERYDSSIDYYATKYLHKEMQKNISNKKFVPDEESWNSESVFFKRYTSNKESKFYVDETDLLPNADEVIKMVKNAGGLVFIPHIYQYEENWKKILDNLVSENKIDGIECFYSTFTKEQTKYLLEFCKENNLYVSGGSDYHGNNSPGIEIGSGKGELYVPEEHIEKWIKKINNKYV